MAVPISLRLRRLQKIDLSIERINMKKSKYPTGEMLPIYTDGEFAFIKGHVNKEEAQSVLDKEFLSEYLLENIEQNYARWGIGTDECGEKIRWLYTNRDKNERGCFAVTTAQYQTR